MLKWNGKEFCPNKKMYTTSLKGKLIMFFKKKWAAQTGLSEAQYELDKRKWKMQDADIALHAALISDDGTLSGKSID